MRSKLERLIPENWSHWLVIATGTFFFLFVLVEFTVSIALYSLASPSPFMYYFTPAGVLLGETLISFYATTALIAGFFIVLRWKVYVKEEGSLKFKRENSRLLLPFYLTAFISLGLYISMIPLSLSNLLTYAVFILLAASFAEHFQVSDYEGMIREYLPQMEKATELVTCPECGFKEAAGAKICSQCGTALRKTRERKVLRSKREEEEELEAEEMIEELEREVETKETMEELEKEVKEMIDGLEKEAETKETMEELEREVEGMIEKLEREVEEPEAEKMLEELESKVEEVWECPICGAEAAIDAEACSVCGEPLNEEEMLKELKGEVEEMMEGLEGTAEEVRECPICGAEVAVDSEVCPLCDEPLKEEEMIEEEVEAEEMMEEL
ncbi:MAG: double zinc ribbon domain-containing protein, partial [Candidatus Natronoplasma sp.]